MVLRAVSPRKAIAAHCKGCIYDKAEPGTWLEQVMNCKITSCELYFHRPRRKASNTIGKDSLTEKTSEGDD